MTVPNFMSKAFFYQDLCRRALCAPRGMIRQKYPGVENNKNPEHIFIDIIK